MDILKMYITLYNKHLITFQFISCSAPESIQSATLTFESIHNVHCGDGLSLCMLRVGNGVSDHVLKKDLENTPSFLVDEARDPLHTASPGKSSDGWLRYSLDVVSENLSVSLSSSLSQTLASFTSSRHFFNL